MRERGAFVARQQFAARGDKAVRAQSMRGRMALDGLYVPAGAPWLADFRAELLSFPAGRHDDQVDAIGLVGQLLDTMVRPAKPKQAVRPVRDRWDSGAGERELEDGVSPSSSGPLTGKAGLSRSSALYLSADATAPLGHRMMYPRG